MTNEELLGNFPNLEKDVCYKILNNPIYYLEDIKDEITKFKLEDEYWNLCIENINSKDFLLIENEFCVMKNVPTKKCDWVIFDNTKLYFIESKDVKPRSRNKERKDAIKQLIASINYFKSKNDISKLTIFSQICFKSNSKIIKTGDQARKVLFKEYNSEFNEGNYITLE
jgi:hypothetical protein